MNYANSRSLKTFPGIYRITNNADGNFYIGSARNLGRRFSTHKYCLRKGNHKNRHMQNAWNYHGEVAFRFEILLICAPEHLLMYEQACIDGYEPHYNVCKVAGNSSGVRRTPDAVRAIIARHTGRIASDVTRQRMSAAGKGKIVSAETRALLSAVNRNRKVTTETRAKISAAGMGRVVSHATREKLSFASKNLKPESRAAISAALRLRVVTDATKKKLSEAKRGHVVSHETKEKLRQAHIGKKLTPEHRAKMSESQKRRHALAREACCEV